MSTCSFYCKHYIYIQIYRITVKVNTSKSSRLHITDHRACCWMCSRFHPTSKALCAMSTSPAYRIENINIVNSMLHNTILMQKKRRTELFPLWANLYSKLEIEDHITLPQKLKLSLKPLHKHTSF